MENKKRICYLEKIRVFALLLVLYAHSGNYGVCHFEKATTPIGYWVSLFMLPVSQCCVVLFFMISGALLLHKQESLKTLYLHRVLPMAVVTVLFVWIQYMQTCLKEQQQFSVVDYGKALYGKGAITEQWFLYAYLSFLLMLPFLRAMAAGLQEQKYYRYLFLLMLVLNTVFPMWEAVSDWGESGLELPILSHILFYPLMGHYLEWGKEEFLHKKKWLIGANAIGLILLIGNGFMNYHSLVVGGKAAYQTLFLPYYTCLLFWDFKAAGNKSRHEAFWTFAGAGVFGTYLLERQLRLISGALLNRLPGVQPYYTTYLLEGLFLAAVGIVCTNLLKKLPILKKLL